MKWLTFLLLTLPAASFGATCYPDLDADLHPGPGSETVETCSANWYEAGHFLAMAVDCDDINAAIYPPLCDRGLQMGTGGRAYLPKAKSGGEALFGTKPILMDLEWAEMETP